MQLTGTKPKLHINITGKLKVEEKNAVKFIDTHFTSSLCMGIAVHGRENKLSSQSVSLSSTF